MFISNNLTKLNDISVVSEDIVYVCSNNVIKTIDGGVTWTTVLSTFDVYHTIEAVDANIVYTSTGAIGLQGYIRKQ